MINVSSSVEIKTRVDFSLHLFMDSPLQVVQVIKDRKQLRLTMKGMLIWIQQAKVFSTFGISVHFLSIPPRCQVPYTNPASGHSFISQQEERTESTSNHILNR